MRTFRTRTNSNRLCLKLSTAILLCSAAGIAAAQTSEPDSVVALQAATPVAEEARQLDVVIVTSRKRVETLQDVPATIGVVTDRALAVTGVNNLQQLQSVAPGVNIAKAPTGSEVGITIRGLGSASGVPSFDSSVSLFVDGVYAPRSREFAASMFDVERIEIIRGTQAALLGKNTSLGAVSLITRKPGDTFAGDIRGSYEFEEGATLLTGGMDVPVSDNLKVRLSGQIGEDKGWVRNLVGDDTAPRIEDSAIRAVAVWTPTDNLELTGLAQHNLIKNFGSPVEFISTTGVPEFLAALAGHPGSIDASLDRVNAVSTPVNGGEQSEKLITDKYALTADISLGDFILTSITAYSKYTNRNFSDADFMPGDYLNRSVDETGKQFSQELRLVSPADGPLDYIVGALYIDGSLENESIVFADFPFGPAPGVNVFGTQATDFNQESEAISAFAQANYKFGNGLTLSSGIRWTQEDKSVDMARTPLAPGLFSMVIYPPYAPFSLSRSEENFDYSIGAQYRVSDTALVYGSYGKGTKGGGYAQSVSLLDQAEYAKEIAKTAEIGIKLEDDAGHWIFNAALFDTHVDDFQLVTFTGLAFIVGNTDLKSRGAEVEARWTPIDGLNLFLNTTYTEAEDRQSGEAIPLAPKLTGNAGFGYRASLTQSLDFKADGSIDHRSKRYYQQNPATSPPGEVFTTFNLGLAIGAPDDAWELRLIGRNLTDENESAFAFPTPILPAGNQNAISERGRTVALQLSARF